MAKPEIKLTGLAANVTIRRQLAGIKASDVSRMTGGEVGRLKYEGQS